MGAKGNVREPRPEISVPDVQYRELKALNYSGLKIFDEDPLEFYNVYVLGRPRMEIEGTPLLIGSLVDFYLLECDGDEDEFLQRFDDKFVKFDGVKGAAQAFSLADYVWESMQKEPGASMRSHFALALERCQRKNLYRGRTLEWAIDNFTGSAAEQYLEKKKHSEGKCVVDNFMVNRAKDIVMQLINDPFTAEIYLHKEDRDGEEETFYKFPIEWEYQPVGYDAIKCKSELDILHVNHRTKQLFYKDNKCSYDNEGFEYSYLKYQYYLQNAFYFLALQWWKDNNGMEQYTVDDGCEFIVADTSNTKRRPLRYNTSHEHIQEGLNGFTFNRKHYKGVRQLVQEIAWCQTNNIWNILPNTYYTQGRSLLRLFNED